MADRPALRAALLNSSEPVFAVLDGAQFDDLPSALSDGALTSRSLYLDHGVDETRRLATAPYLIWLDRADGTAAPAHDGTPLPDVVDRALSIVKNRHTGVFWACAGGGDALFRHLRSINMVRFPTDARFDPGKDYEVGPVSKPTSETPLGATHEMVLFRHSDTNVMAQVLPALRPDQFLRLFGPASLILFLPDDEYGSGLMRAPRPDDPVAAARGALTLDRETVERVEARRVAAVRKRRVSYLLETCGPETAGASHEAVEEHLRVSEETGKRLGLVSEGAHCRWSFVMCKTNGRVLQQQEALDYIRGGPESPDVRMKMFMSGIVDALRVRSHDRAGG